VGARRRRPIAQHSAVNATADFAFFPSETMELEPHAHHRATTMISQKQNWDTSTKRKIQRNNRVNATIVRPRAARSFARRTAFGACQPPGLYPESCVEVDTSAVGIRQSSVVASIARPPGQHVCQQHVQQSNGRGGAGRGDRQGMVRLVKISHVAAMVCLLVGCAAGGGGRRNVNTEGQGRNLGRRSVAAPVQAARISCPKGSHPYIYPPHDHFGPLPYVLSLCGRLLRFDRSSLFALLARKQAMACSGARAGRRAGAGG
jgi:hypothetical protein